jgi:hypothetical protein
VTRYLRKARIREPRRGGDGTQLSEPILVFVGDQYRGQGEFDVFDQDASPVGLAIELDVAHFEFPCSWHYELRDLQGRSVLSCRVVEAQALARSPAEAGSCSGWQAALNNERTQ